MIIFIKNSSTSDEPAEHEDRHEKYAGFFGNFPICVFILQERASNLINDLNGQVNSTYEEENI